MKAVVPGALDGERVDRAVAVLTGLPRSEVASLVAGGAIRIGDAPVSSRSRRVAEGDELEVVLPEGAGAPDPGPEADSSVEVAVVHEDGDLIVVDKPAGLVVHAGAGHRTGTLVHGLLARFPDLAAIGAGEAARPGIVHRLDKGTSGLLVVARTASAYEDLVEQLRRRAVERVYVTLVCGRVDAPAGLIDAPVGRGVRDPTRMAVTAGGKEARTRYRVEARFSEPVPVSLLECRLETGRTHQVRVHLAAIGHPVVGDTRYRGVRTQLVLGRPFLHATRLSFDHPTTGERLAFSSPLPDDLQTLLSELR
ncbi:MAG TPA: RluA family pseudouridine synthase [Acidimicrobiales bacterium]|nr:RluA family pseudouridine synthase [Acidimicrobiales bacterium]